MPTLGSIVETRNVIVAGKERTITLENAFWHGLRDAAKSKRTTIEKLIARIDDGRSHRSLASGIRLYLLDYYLSLAHNPRRPRTKAAHVRSTVKKAA